MSDAIEIDLEEIHCTKTENSHFSDVILNETHYTKTTNLGIHVKWSGAFFPKSYPSKSKLKDVARVPGLEPGSSDPKSDAIPLSETL